MSWCWLAGVGEAVFLRGGVYAIRGSGLASGFDRGLRNPRPPAKVSLLV